MYGNSQKSIADQLTIGWNINDEIKNNTAGQQVINEHDTRTRSEKAYTEW